MHAPAMQHAKAPALPSAIPGLSCHAVEMRCFLVLSMALPAYAGTRLDMY